MVLHASYYTYGDVSSALNHIYFADYFYSMPDDMKTLPLPLFDSIAIGPPATTPLWMHVLPLLSPRRGMGRLWFW